MADIGTVFPLICPLKMQQIAIIPYQNNYALGHATVYERDFMLFFFITRFNLDNRDIKQ